MTTQSQDVFPENVKGRKEKLFWIKIKNTKNICVVASRKEKLIYVSKY